MTTQSELISLHAYIIDTLNCIIPQTFLQIKSTKFVIHRHGPHNFDFLYNSGNNVTHYVIKYSKVDIFKDVIWRPTHIFNHTINERVLQILLLTIQCINSLQCCMSLKAYGN